MDIKKKKKKEEESETGNYSKDSSGGIDMKQESSR